MCSMVDDHFVEIFKKEHNEQFFVLVKMHLSFLLHMTTEETECFYEKVKLKKWNIVPFGKKSKHRNVHEGPSLTQEGISQLYQLINFIQNEENLKSEGVFRRTGSLERQNDLKNLLSQGTNVSFHEGSFNVHDCASVLKNLLSELPEPLITDIQFPVYCQIADSYKVNNVNHETKILQCLQLLFLLLPKENKNLLKDILRMLHSVTLHEKDNRMSSDNLAKLFTPHLLCPRKLPPETLLKNSQSLFGIVSFMIKKFPELFKIPSQLMLDFRAHYEQKNILNESVKGAAHTVFTFVDNKLTAKENEENVTETALAQLYAHIQSLPESSKKRKLVKQFNKENGQGTPLQIIRSSMPKNKSFGDSIKKHMFHKKLMMKNAKKNGFLHLRSASSEEILNSPHSSQKTTRGRLFCHNFDSSTEDDENPSKRLKSAKGTPVERPRSKSDSDLSFGDVSGIPGQYLTSTPACGPLRVRGDGIFTPEGQDRTSMSPITRSTQRMPRAMQETMMTPRSRKPVLLVSGTNINNLAKVSPETAHLNEAEEEPLNGQKEEKLRQKEEEAALYQGRFYRWRDENGDPRQRKNTGAFPKTDQAQCDGKGRPESTKRLFVKTKSDGDLISVGEPKEKMPKMNKTDSPVSLTASFRQYMSGRDMLVFESPTDSSFSSRTDDFNSSKETMGCNDDFTANYDDISNGKMTDSMLYVLDGNDPRGGDESGGRKEPVLKPRQFDERGKPIVFETSF